MKTRSSTASAKRHGAWGGIVQTLKAQTSGGNKSALMALTHLSSMNTGLRKEVGMNNYKHSLERELLNKIKVGNREAYRAALRVLPARKIPQITRLWSNARRNQLSNRFFNNFGRITHVENTGNNDGGRYITTNKGRWAFYPVTHAFGPHQLYKHNHTTGQWRAFGSLMGPFNFRNGQLVLANRGNNWHPPIRRHEDVFSLH
jgi:hypothetical protein